MSNKLTDHDIASLYHKGAQEQPSTTLDAHILQLAKNQTPINQVSPIIKKRRLYQTWYAQLSTAASFVLVAVLYFEMNKPFHQDENMFEQHNIKQQSDLFLTDAISMEKSKQAARIKQTKSHSQKVQHQMHQSTEILPLESQEMEVYDTFAASQEQVTKLSKESELANIEATFKQIEALLDKGENKQAKAALKDLLTSYPKLRDTLNSRFQTLERQAIP